MTAVRLIAKMIVWMESKSLLPCWWQARSPWILISDFATLTAWLVPSVTVLDCALGQP